MEKDKKNSKLQKRFSDFDDQSRAITSQHEERVSQLPTLTGPLSSRGNIRLEDEMMLQQMSSDHSNTTPMTPHSTTSRRGI